MAKCNGCGCTDERACEGGCEWVFISKPLMICSACAGGERDLDATIRAACRLLTNGLLHKMPPASAASAARYLLRKFRERRSLELALRSDEEERVEKKRQSGGKR